MAVFSYNDKTFLQKLRENSDINNSNVQLFSTTGLFYCPYQSGNGAVTTATTHSSGVVRLVPFRIAKRIKLTSIGVILVNGATPTGRFRYGLCKIGMGNTIYPSSVFWQSSEITTTANGAFPYNNLSLLLDPGLYGFWIWTNAATNIPGGARTFVFRGIPALNQDMVLGYQAVTDPAMVNRLELTREYTGAPLPTLFPTGGSWLTSAFIPELLLIKSTVL